MPDNLKSLLVDDWENVTKNQQVVALPAKSSVNQILEQYVTEEKEKRTTAAEFDVLEEVVMGIREYFDKSLDKILLYRFEREQYRVLRKKWEGSSGDFADKGPLDIYGAEHLTRLFGMSKLSFEVFGLHSQYHSHNARTHRTDKHGPPVHQQTPRRTLQVHNLAEQKFRQILRHQIHDSE